MTPSVATWWLPSAEGPPSLDVTCSVFSLLFSPPLSFWKVLKTKQAACRLVAWSVTTSRSQWSCSSSPLVSRWACQPALRPPRRVPSAICSPTALSLCLTKPCSQMHRATARKAHARKAHARKAHAPMAPNRLAPVLMAPNRLAPNREVRNREALTPTRSVRTRSSTLAFLTSLPPTVQCHPCAGIAGVSKNALIGISSRIRPSPSQLTIPNSVRAVCPLHTRTPLGHAILGTGDPRKRRN